MADQKVAVVSRFTGKKTLQEILKEIIMLKWKSK
ncbi:hypothetical protein HNQ80_001645 [Anaerosolibacter carboniphilus]|uniref:Uncharacterized protein n=1 Tax=Anaerosolibacter carboniphilus TaxID=1417629 RepID=A0A841KQ01_9FIRM|nr:hypothetical protein [Anaerosolibacter carboniphilus]